MKISNDFGNKFKGSIDEQVTASEWKGRNYLKAYQKPSNPSTPQQEEKRGWLADGMAIWQALNEYQKEAYFFHARHHKEELSPLNSFLRSYLNIKQAGDSYTNPSSGWVQYYDSVTSLYLPGVTSTVRIYKGTVVYRVDYPLSGVKVWWGFVNENPWYDLYAFKEGYQPGILVHRSAADMVNRSFALVPI